MPRVDIWIRKDNLIKWEAIPDKSNWVNTLLKNSDDTSLYGKERPSPAGPIVTILSEKLPEGEMFNKLPTSMPKTLKEANDPNHSGYSARIVPDLVKLCKHGAVPKFCKFAKPGKSCR